MPWGSKRGDAPPAVWQHDVFHPDGAPWDPSEIELVKALARPTEGRTVPSLT